MQVIKGLNTLEFTSDAAITAKERNGTDVIYLSIKAQARALSSQELVLKVYQNQKRMDARLEIALTFAQRNNNGTWLINSDLTTSANLSFEQLLLSYRIIEGESSVVALTQGRATLDEDEAGTAPSGVKAIEVRGVDSMRRIGTTGQHVISLSATSDSLAGSVRVQTEDGALECLSSTTQAECTVDLGERGMRLATMEIRALPSRAVLGQLPLLEAEAWPRCQGTSSGCGEVTRYGWQLAPMHRLERSPVAAAHPFSLILDQARAHGAGGTWVSVTRMGDREGAWLVQSDSRFTPLGFEMSSGFDPTVREIVLQRTSAGAAAVLGAADALENTTAPGLPGPLAPIFDLTATRALEGSAFSSPPEELTFVLANRTPGALGHFQRQGQLPLSCGLVDADFLRCTNLSQPFDSAKRLAVPASLLALPTITRLSEARLVAGQPATLYLALSAPPLQPLYCGLRGRDGALLLGEKLERAGVGYKCRLDYVGAAGSVQALFVTSDGSTLEFYGNRTFEVAGPAPILASAGELVMGSVLSLEGERFPTGARVLLGGTQELQPLAVTPSAIQVQVPADLSPGNTTIAVRGEQGLVSNVLSVLARLPITFTPQFAPVGVWGQRLRVPFSASQQLRETDELECLVTSRLHNTSVVARSAGEEGCGYACELPTFPLHPGPLELKVRLGGVEYALTPAQLHDFSGYRLLESSVLASETHLPIVLRGSAQPVGPLFCEFRNSIAGVVRARALAEPGEVACQAGHLEPGPYRVALTGDGVHTWTSPQPLLVVEDRGIVVTDVVPRLQIAATAPASTHGQQLHLLGRGLAAVSADQVTVFLDGSEQPLTSFAVDEGIVSLALAGQAANETRVEVRGKQAGKLLFEPVVVRSVPQPEVHPQATTLYPGEPLALTGSALFDQLDLWCVVGAQRDRATVLSPTRLTCPASLLRDRPVGERASVAVWSESLQQWLDGKRVTAVLVAVPEVEALARSFVLLPARDPPQVKLRLASPALERAITLTLEEGEHACGLESAVEAVCPIPPVFRAAGAQRLRLRLWPGGPSQEVRQTLQVVQRPRLSAVAPRALTAGLEERALGVTGSGFEAAQPWIGGVRLASGHTGALKVLSDTEAEASPVRGWPAVPARPLSVTQLALSLADGSEAGRQDLLIVSHVEGRALSPPAVTQSAQPHRVLISTRAETVALVPYTCLLYRPGGQLVQQGVALRATRRHLQCVIGETHGPGEYLLGLAVGPGEEPAALHAFRVLAPPRLAHFRGAAPYYLQRTEAELLLTGAWDWHADLPAPLVVVRDAEEGGVLATVPGRYGSPAESLVHFTLPPLDRRRIRVELA